MTDKKKQELIERIAHSLDITPEMYDQSQSVVRGLTNYVKNIDPSVVVYKQGSFKLGTIIRPYRKDKYGDFDIDLVVQFSDRREQVKPSDIKQRLGEYLEKSNYKKFLDEEGSRCWTLNYPHMYGNTTLSFHIDLLPCVDELNSVKLTIKPDDWQETAVAITHIEDKRTNPYKYIWKTSNPFGFAEWFDSVNYGKYKAVKTNDRQRIFENYKYMFASAEEVGEDYTRSPLQMVIQILKRHRDVMYANTEHEDFKPISIIITTLVGKIVEENSIIENNTYKLLNSILKGLEFYASLLTSGITSDFSDDYKTKKLISKRMIDGKVVWSIKNPANSAENLADKWCKDSKYATEFFRWVKQAQIDLVDILEGDNKFEDIRAKLKYCLDVDIENILSGFNFSEISQPRPFNMQRDIPKPYNVTYEL